MEELWIKVFSSQLSDEVYKKINENPEFKLTSKNVHEFMYDTRILQLLKDNKIEYKISINDYWTGSKYAKYNCEAIIYVQENDVNEAKRLLEENNIFTNYQDDFNISDEKTSKNISKTFFKAYVWIGLVIIFIALVLCILSGFDLL